MITQSDKDDIQAGYRQFLAEKSFQPRRSQREMVAEVARVFARTEEGCGAALIEAGTGTGKTLAYLLPGIVLAHAQKKKLIIATATVALQEQLIQKDVPEVLAALSLDLKVGLAKGRRRFLCLIKLDQLLEGASDSASAAPLFPDEISGNASIAEGKLQTLLDAYMDKRWDGDRDHWVEAFDDNEWRALSTDRTQCTNRHCRFFKACPFFIGRADLSQADIIVANHDLLLSNRIISSDTLPEPDESLLVIDEAHHFLDKTREHQGQGLGLGALAGSLESMPDLLKAYHQCAEEGGWLSGAASEEARQVEHQSQIALSHVVALKELLLELIGVTNVERGGSTATPDDMSRPPRFQDYRFRHREHSPEVSDEFGAWTAPLAMLHQLLDGARDATEIHLGHAPMLLQSKLEQLLAAFGQFTSRLETAMALAAIYREAAASPDVPIARWVRSVGSEVFVSATPVAVDDFLRSQFWTDDARVVMTSATLSAAGQFDLLKRDLGLPEDAVSACFPSPFDYANNAQLRIPPMRSSATEPGAHTEEIAGLIPELLSQSNTALVLSTSWRQLEAVVDGLPAALRDHCWIQGELSKGEILRRHRDAVDQGDASYIIGLSSFAEGIDLPGAYCEHVILCKLPFAVPDDPMGATLSEWYEDQGRDAFMEYSLPMAAVRLAQAAGRLIRSETDRGMFTILDTRLKTKRYGRILIRAIPPFAKEGF
ncbi:MAG: ATP-dependent DNA helicase DinG [Gammaproteobacteria bacterium]